MRQPTDSLLDTLNNLTDSSPEKWGRTSSRTCFLFSPYNPAITICKYLNEKNEHNINICTIDENGKTIKNIVFNEINDKDIYNIYLPFYNRVKDMVMPNAINSMNNSLIKNAS